MKPRKGLTTEVEIIRWRDADTPIVEIRRQFAVRLTDLNHEKSFNAPEISTTEGKLSKNFIEEYCKGKEITLFIPSENPLQLTDITSFDRIVGELWVDDEKVTDVLIKEGYGEFKKYK